MQVPAPRYLSDGRIALGESSGNRLALRVIGADGATKTIDLGAGSRLAISREVAPGQVIVEAGAPRVVDIDRGVVVRQAPGVIMVGGSGVGGWRFYPRPMINSASVILSTRRGLLTWNALTGQAKTLIGG